jgi:hypothetical protein
MVVNDELELLWKEAVIAVSEAIYWLRTSGSAEEKQEKR